MAKTLTGLYGVQGVYNYLAPEKNNEMYGIKGSKMSNFIGEGVGSFVLSSAAAMYAMIYHTCLPSRQLEYQPSQAWYNPPGPC